MYRPIEDSKIGFLDKVQNPFFWIAKQQAFKHWKTCLSTCQWGSRIMHWHFVPLQDWMVRKVFGGKKIFQDKKLWRLGKNVSAHKKRSIVNVTFCVAFSLNKGHPEDPLRQIKKELKKPEGLLLCYTLWKIGYFTTVCNKDFCGKHKQDFDSR